MIYDHRESYELAVRLWEAECRAFTQAEGERIIALRKQLKSKSTASSAWFRVTGVARLSSTGSARLTSIGVGVASGEADGVASLRYELLVEE
jgi:hypothetical protein